MPVSRTEKRRRTRSAACSSASTATTTSPVVDDHGVARMVLRRYLRDLAFEVETAGSGAEAVVTLRAAEQAGRRFDLVLLDWRMPRPDGLETAREIKRSLARPPAIILVTGHGRDEAAAEMKNAGIDGFLVKPVTSSVLLDSIGQVLGWIPARGRAAARRG